MGGMGNCGGAGGIAQKGGRRSRLFYDKRGRGGFLRIGWVRKKSENVLGAFGDGMRDLEKDWDPPVWGGRNWRGGWRGRHLSVPGTVDSHGYEFGFKRHIVPLTLRPTPQPTPHPPPMAAGRKHKTQPGIARGARGGREKTGYKQQFPRRHDQPLVRRGE